MIVTVKRKHIIAGAPKDALHCPIGLALKEKFGEVTVNEDNVEINGLKFQLASQAQRFIEQFDEGKPVKPFAFELKLLWE